jgi:hypothetical protein
LDPNWITAVATAITALVAIYLILSAWMDKKKANLFLSMRTIFEHAQSIESPIRNRPENIFS